MKEEKESKGDKYIIVHSKECNMQCLKAFQEFINELYSKGYRAEGGITIYNNSEKYIQVMVKDDYSP